MQESTLLITSRPIASGELQGHCSTRIEIIGFTPAEVKKYFREALREAHQEDQHVALQECLEVRPVIQASCYLPLNAAIVVHLFITEGNTLPTTLHGLFTTLVLNCIVRHLKRETKREGKRMPKLKEIQPYFSSICALAFYGIKNNKATFSEKDLHSVHLSKPEQLLSLIQGWFTFKSFGKELSYSFFHLSIQELLAAYHIHKRCSPSEQVQIFRELFDQPRFAAVLQFYAAFTKFKLEGIREFLKEVLLESELSDMKIVHKSILNCLYEAQDPSLCQYVATVMNAQLVVTYTLSPHYCMALGYFLSCIALTPGGGKIHMEFVRDCEFNDYKCNYFVNELKKCERGKLSLSLSGSGDQWVKTASMLNSRLQDSCSCCISELSISAKLRTKQENQILTESLLGKNSNHTIPVVSLDFRQSTVVTEVSKFVSGSKSIGLKVLNISQSTITHVRALAGALADRSTLETLDLSGCDIRKNDAALLAEALNTNSTLRVLDLSGCSVQTEGASALAISLARNTGLTELNLSCCEILLEDICVALRDSLTKNKTLEILTLSQSKFVGCKGINLLTEALAVNSTLTTLDISGCRVGHQGTQELQSLLVDGKSLQVLILADNDLSCPKMGTYHFPQGLKQNGSLRSLSIARCNLDDHAMDMVVRALEEHPLLQELSFGGNRLTDDGLKGLSGGLKKIKCLQKVTLVDKQHVWRKRYARAQGELHSEELETPLIIGSPRRKSGDQSPLGASPLTADGLFSFAAELNASGIFCEYEYHYLQHLGVV